MIMPSSPSAEHCEDDEASILPLDQPDLSNPVYRRHIAFVLADLETPASSTPTSTSTSAADRYFNVVFGSTAANSITTLKNSHDSHSSALRTEQPLCPICHLPLSLPPSENLMKTHECLLAHQLSLPHSHPPSHLPRSNKGLQYLSSYGWDPDSRQGLGTDGKGIRVPIKPNIKADTVGLGVRVNKNRGKEPRPAMLDAGKVRKLEKNDKKQKEKLQREFWGRDDIEKHLGAG